MTPVEDNPYGVRVPGSGHSLPGLETPPTDDHPLVPWDEPGHTAQWVDVDHAREQVARFGQQTLDRLGELVTPGVGAGRLVVVSGPRGMGKTTLIHRCIYEAGEYIARLSGVGRPPALRRIVAMTGGYRNTGSRISIDENGDFAAMPVVNGNIRDQIHATLCRHFEDVKIDPAIAEEPPAKAFGAISVLLAQQDALLFAVIPHIDWKDAGVRTNFLKTCLNHARTRIVLFVEVSQETNEAAEAVIGELPDGAVTHLALGQLTSEDTVKFSAGPHHSSPHDLPPAVRAGLIAAHDAQHPADVRELRQVFYAAAEQRRHGAAGTPITADELSGYWQPGAPDLRSLTRHSPQTSTGS